MHTPSLLALIAVSLSLGGCKKREVRQVSDEAPPVRVEAHRVEPQPFDVTVPITGTLVSTAKVEVKAETTGKVLRFPKEEGEAVRAGEAVIWVDDSYKKLAVLQAEAGVQTAEAALERSKILEAHNRSEYVRAQNLLKSGGITDRDYRAAELADRDARAQVALAAAQLVQARTQLEHARKALADSIIYAPIDGEIQAKLVRPGAYVEPPTSEVGTGEPRGDGGSCPHSAPSNGELFSRRLSWRKVPRQGGRNQPRGAAGQPLGESPHPSRKS
jgi:multidrug efflux pump subunit AcrA (membrane-fusion protein)